MPMRIAQLSLFALLISVAAAPASAVSVLPADTLVGSTRTTPPVLYTVFSTDPSMWRGQVTVHGMRGAEQIMAMDFRPLDGVLYAVGSSGRLYTIDEKGKATEVTANPLPITGSDVGMDIGATDMITLVNTDGTNLSVSPITGVPTAGTALAYLPADPNVGVTPKVEALATAAGGVMFGIDKATASLVTLPVPANGLMTTVGALGIAPESPIGFDISPTGTGYLSFAPAGDFSGTKFLYTVNLATGAVTLVGQLYRGAGDIAVAPAGYTLPPVISDNSAGSLDPLSMTLILAGAAFARRRRR